MPNDQAGVNHNLVVVNQEQAEVNRDQAVMNHIRLWCIMIRR